MVETTKAKAAAGEAKAAAGAAAGGAADGKPPARVLPTRAARMASPAVPRTQLQQDCEDVAVEVYNHFDFFFDWLARLYINNGTAATTRAVPNIGTNFSTISSCIDF